MAHAKDNAPQVYNGVSEADVPSARFGWSAFTDRTIQIAGWISVLFLVAYNFGNHEGHVETIWLVVLAVLIALGLILQATKPKLNQVRTVTAHNKPVGHQEPDWIYNQATLSSDAYENLTDSQLRALNIEPSRVAHLRPARGEERAVEGSVSRPVAAPTEREDVEVVTVEPRGKHSRI
nr:DUF2631 domain-containing protein [uncultured Corynebacterium sp.]